MNEAMNEQDSKACGRAGVQGWLGLAFWMSFGLLFETLMAYRAPSYLEDGERRELFRLAHAHGSAFGFLLVAASLWVNARRVKLARLSWRALRAGTVLMPFGFLFAGVWHPEGDPGLAIWLVPIGAIALVFGLISVALTRKAR